MVGGWRGSSSLAFDRRSDPCPLRIAPAGQSFRRNRLGPRTMSQLIGRSDITHPPRFAALDPVIRGALRRDQAARDAIVSELLRYRDQRGDDWNATASAPVRTLPRLLGPTNTSDHGRSPFLSRR